MKIEFFICLFFSAVFILHIFLNGRSVRNNKYGKCAKCACDISAIDNVSVVASHHRYFYCQTCGSGVKLRDRIFMGMFVLISVSLIGAYIAFK
jgi:hypothetical protein